MTESPATKRPACDYLARELACPHSFPHFAERIPADWQMTSERMYSTPAVARAAAGQVNRTGRIAEVYEDGVTVAEYAPAPTRTGTLNIATGATTTDYGPTAGDPQQASDTEHDARVALDLAGEPDVAESTYDTDSGDGGHCCDTDADHWYKGSGECGHCGAEWVDGPSGADEDTDTITRKTNRVAALEAALEAAAATFESIRQDSDDEMRQRALQARNAAESVLGRTVLMSPAKVVRS